MPKLPYPFRSLGMRWSRLFLGGLLVLIVVMSVLDAVLHDWEYVRVLDYVLILIYGGIWMVAYWVRPDLFRR